MEKIIKENEEEVACSAAKWWAVWAVIAGIWAAANKIYLAPDIASALGFKLSSSAAAFGWAGAWLWGTAVGLAWASAASFLAGSMIERNAETPNGKALWKGMAFTGWVWTLAGAVWSAAYVFSLPTWGVLLSTFGWAVALMILYSLISGNKKEAEKIIKDKQWEEKGSKTIKELEKSFEKEVKKETIRV